MPHRSAAFNFNDLGKSYVKLSNRISHSEMLVRAEIIMQGASVFIVLHREEKLWPYRIDNRSPVDITLQQAVRRGDGGD